jgi:hexulose-6-phosphate isomerase
MLGVMQGRLVPSKSGLIQEFPWSDWKKEFRFANQVGLKLIEWTLEYENLENNPFITSLGQLEIIELSKKFDVSVESVTLNCFMNAPLHREHPVTRKKSSIFDLINIIKRSSRLGVKVGVLPLVVEAGTDNKETFLDLFELLDSLRELCDVSDFKIALECEYNLEVIKWISMQIEKLPHVGFNFDIGNSASLGNDPLAEIDLYGDKLMNIHIKDRLKKGVTVPLGQGAADFKKIFKKLKEVNYRNNLILQAARQNPNSELETIGDYLKFCENYM